MPDVTPTNIADVFNHRLAAYCYDTHARTLRLDFVESVFEAIGSKSGYRDYLNRIITELEHNNVSIVNTPIALDDAELGAIKKALEQDAALRSSINKLVFESKFKRFTGQQVNKCLELLVQTCLQGGVSEADKLFNDNRHYFQHIRDLGLIQKQRSKSGQQTAFRWVIHSRMQKAIDTIESRFKRGISDYLMKLYAGATYSPTATTAPGVSLLVESKQLLRVLADDTLPSALKDTLLSAQRTFESLQFREASSDQRDAIIERASLALTNLFTALFQMDQSAPFFARARIDRLEDRLSLHWASEEGVVEAFRRIAAFRLSPTRLLFESAHKQSMEAFVAVSDVLFDVHCDISDVNRPAPFRHRAVRHTLAEFAILQDVEKYYFSADSQKHFGYVERVTNYLEERFRAFLFVTASAVFGEERYFDCVPKADAKYAHRNIESRSTFSSVGNRFDGLTRPQFRSLFMETDIKRLIIDAVPITWQPADWKLFWDLFVEENIATSHKQHGAYSAAERSRYAKYCKLAEELTAKLNQLVSEIVEKNAIVVADGTTNKRLQTNDCMFRCGFMFKDGAPAGRIVDMDNSVFKWSDRIGDHWIQEDVYGKVIGNVMSKLNASRVFAEDLLEIEYIRSHYDVTNLQFVASLVFAKYVEQVIDVIPWFGSSVLIRRRA